jgi:hypothetical protein
MLLGQAVGFVALLRVEIKAALGADGTHGLNA